MMRTTLESPNAIAPVITPLLPPVLPGNPRNSEGDFALLNDGSILFAYTHFTGDLHNDHEPAYLAGRLSYDSGTTWSERDHLVLPGDGRMNVMSVSLRRTLKGELAIFYNRKNSITDCRMQMRISSDEGRSWGDATNCIPEAGYYPVNNDRVVRLSSKRLVIPAARHGVIIDRFGEPGVGDRGEAIACYSDDDGVTWKQSRSVMTAPEESTSGLQEPGVIELRNGRLMLWARTDMGCQYQSFSEDGGETWGPARPSNIISPLSPASIKRLPQTGDLMLVWNDHRKADAADRGCFKE